MGSFSDYLENEILDHVLGSAYTQPTIYIGLGTGASDTGLTGEPGSGNYAREAHASWTSASSRTTSNSGAITFNTASGSWGTLSHYGIFDASSGGNLLAWGTLDTAKTVVSGNTPSIADGEIDISFNASSGGVGWSSYLVHKVLDHIFEGTSYTPETLYAGLTSVQLTDTSSITGEPSGNNYSRPNASTPGWDAASGGTTDNTAAITFPTPSGSWGSMSYCFLANHASNTAATNLLMFGDITDQTPDDGDTVQFDAGDFDVTIT
jgi:hypothetical protein